LSLRNVHETLAVSAPTVVDALTRETCDAPFEQWASHVVASTEAMISVSNRDVFVTLHPVVDPERFRSMNDPRAARDALVAEVRRSIASGL
jgi:hypothetical protein